jgi:putative ABC transport system substrate-binding protein
MITRRRFLAALTASALPVPSGFSRGQPAVRVAFLAVSMPRDSQIFEAFVRNLKELGWVEGKNVEIHFQPNATEDDLAPLAAKAVQNKFAVIVTAGSRATAAARAATGTIPIVFGSAANPVEQKFVRTLARPGGNVTGVALTVQELGGKRFQLLKEMLPRSTRLARMYDSSSIAGLQRQIITADESAARVLGVQLKQFPVTTLQHIEAAFAAAARNHVDGMHVTSGPVLVAHLISVSKLGLEYRIPVLGPDVRFAQAGTLASYGEDLNARYRRVALLVHKILRGAKPADMPVEQPGVFEFALNLRTAQALGIVLPESIVLQADRVIT